MTTNPDDPADRESPPPRDEPIAGSTGEPAPTSHTERAAASFAEPVEAPPPDPADAPPAGAEVDASPSRPVAPTAGEPLPAAHGEILDASPAPPRDGDALDDAATPAAGPVSAEDAPPSPESAPADAERDGGTVPATEGTAVATPEPRREIAPGRVRAFLAVNVPLAVVRRVSDEVQALRRELVAAGVTASWVPPANMHVTLKFLGGVRVEVVEAVRSALVRGVSGRVPFEVVAKGLGAFPSPSHPRVLWAGIEAPPALGALFASVEAAMVDLGFAAEERPYHPHLTVARITSGGGGHGQVAASLAARDGLIFGAGRIGEVVIYESRLRPTGAEYRALERVPLSG